MTRKTDTAVNIDIARQNDLWPSMDEDLTGAIQATLLEAGFAGETEISLVLADDALIQGLNKQYRGKDKPTNVLSFPQDEEFSLGDIVLALETIEKEAREQNKTFRDHVIHLTVHGTLHLLGHDHENPDEAADMEELEIRILHKLGINNPYETGDMTAGTMPYLTTDHVEDDAR